MTARLFLTIQTDQMAVIPAIPAASAWEPITNDWWSSSWSCLRQEPRWRGAYLALGGAWA